MKNITSIVFNNFKNDSRVLKECLTLKKYGYNVNVVAYYEKPLKEYDIIHNIPVHRIKLIIEGWPKKKFLKIIKYLEYFFQVVKHYKHSDILHCNDLETLPIGVVIKIFFNRDVKIIYDAHEYETETKDLKGTWKKIIKLLEKNLIKYADKVITVSDSIANEYVRLYNIEKPTLVLNTLPYIEIVKKDIFRETLRIKNEQKIFIYQGGLTKDRGIEIILESFKLLWNDLPAYYKDEKKYPVIIFMGYGPLENLIRNYSNEYKNIYFHPAVDQDILIEYTSSADFGILFYEDTCLNHKYCSPNKIFEYFMAEIPVIVSNLYEMKRLIETYKVGIVVKENTSEELKKAILRILSMNFEEVEYMKQNIKKIKTIFNWEKQEKEILKVYRDLYR